jgi:hypothetical protein
MLHEPRAMVGHRECTLERREALFAKAACGPRQPTRISA